MGARLWEKGEVVKAKSRGGSRAWSLYATLPSPPPPPPGVLRDSGVGAMALTAPKFFYACFFFHQTIHVLSARLAR